MLPEIKRYVGFCVGLRHDHRSGENPPGQLKIVDWFDDAKYVKLFSVHHFSSSTKRVPLMTDNPFASPQPVSGDNSLPSKQKAPGALMAILIICLVLGILGLLGSCFGGVALAFQTQINQLQANNPDPIAKKMQAEMQEVQQQQFIPNLIMIGLNFIVAPLLITGAIGGLNRKPWAYKFLTVGLLLAVFYVVVRAVLTITIQLATMGTVTKAMQEGIQQQGGANAAQGAEFAGNLMQFGIYAVIAVSVLWSLLQLGFYIWSWTYLRKDQTRSYLGVD